MLLAPIFRAISLLIYRRSSATFPGSALASMTDRRRPMPRRKPVRGAASEPHCTDAGFDFDRQRRPARRVKVDSAPDRRDTRVLGRWFGGPIAPFPEHCTSNAIAKSSGGVGIITRPIVRLARSSSFYHFVQMDGHRRWVLANERSHLSA